MSAPAFIGADELAEAMHAHADRTAILGPRPVHRIIASLHVDAEEFQAAAQVIADHRQPEDRGIFAAGLLDGFVLGVRATRAASETGGEEQ